MTQVNPLRYANFTTDRGQLINGLLNRGTMFAFDDCRLCGTYNADKTDEDQPGIANHTVGAVVSHAATLLLFILTARVIIVGKKRQDE
jgi:hypothetical protein